MRLVLTLLVAACGATRATPPPEETPSVRPESPAPPTRRDDTVVTRFGVDVPDPYAWLEDLDGEETAAFVAAQNTHARAHLDALPHRQALSDHLTALWTYARWGTPKQAGQHLFHAFNDGTMDQAVLLVRDTPTSDPRVLIDPASWSEDGTVSLAGWDPTHDGRLVAYTVQDAGSDWRVVRVRDVATGADLPDEVRWVKFGGSSWLRDGSGFLYARFPEPAPQGDATFSDLGNQSVYLHRLGTPQSDDVLVHADPANPKRFHWAGTSEDGAWIILYVEDEGSDKNRVWLTPTAEVLATPAGQAATPTWSKVFDDADARYEPIDVLDGQLIARTDKDAPNGRVVRVPVDGSAPISALIPATGDALRGAQHIGGELLLSYLHDAHSVLVRHGLDGSAKGEVVLPGLGSIGGVSGSADATTAFLSYESFTEPDTVYALDVTTGDLSQVFQPEVDADLSALTTEQVFVTSKDGTQVPIYLVHRKDVDASAPRPTLLYGYGGFDIPITPGFRVSTLAWLELGGVYASANLRGGGEYGSAWHHAGTQQTKQNVFDDFIAAAEWLIREGWTTSDQLGIHGRSNGGLLVGAAMTQRPDLFGAAVPSVGVQDMLKYHQWTIGWAWVSDYGSSEVDESMFRYLLGYSPVHNTRAGTSYPPTLVTTADHDDRVVPAHSFKFAAALQHDQAGDAPVVLRVETRAGHGAGTPISMLVAEQADVLAFLAYHLGVPTP